MALNYCFSCNAVINSAFHIFGNLSLQSQRKLEEVLSEIIDKPLKKNTVHSQFICKKCYTVVSEYDSLKIRLQVIKQELTSELKNTLPRYNLNYETFGQSPIKSPARVVLPASKLQPVPANYMLDIGKMASVSKSGLLTSAASTVGLPGLYKVTSTTAKPSVNLRVTVGSTVLTQTLSSSIIKSRPKITVSTTDTLTSPQKSTDYRISDKIISSLVTPNRTSVKKNPVLSFNVNSLPKEFLSSAVSNKTAKEEKEDDDDVDNNDDNTMEIDEACTFSVAVATDEDGKIVFENKPIDIKSKSNFFDVGLLLSQDGTRESDKDVKYNILDKLKILNDGDDEEDETIVMEDDKTTIIRMVSGQKVFLDGNKISLVQGSDNDGIDNADSLDSNDESQIELQVSGDEEIANALINAAQGQGGAFIKVESGEMYRVESVRSKLKDESDASHLQNIVERESDDGNVYRCLLCQYNMKKAETVKGDAETIMAHLKNIHNARAYICLVCGVVMRKRTEYTAHLESHNQGKTVISKSKLYHCTMCNKKFNSKTLLNTHMNMHAGNRPYACTVCGKTFASKYTHQAHLKTHSTRPRPYKCEQCGKTFFTQQNLTQHEKTHSGLKEFVCTICNKAFATQHNLEVHGVIHSGVKPYSCPICNKSFARRAEIRDHMRIHTGERPFACDICGATFTQRSNLHSHKRATHLDDKRYLCTQCPKRFKRRRLLDYHLKAVHTGERPLQCNICRATFVYPEHYKKHARIHSGEKPYVCEVCGKSFNSRDNRNMHRFVHSDKKPYECLTCGAGYMRKQLLYTHMNTTGHIAESIVVNQPRVIKTVENGITAPLIDVHGIQIKTNKLTDSILDEPEELEFDENQDNAMAATESDETQKLFMNEDKKIILQDKSTINLVQNAEDATMLTLHNINGIEWKDGTEFDKLDDDQQMMTTDKGGTMRLIQIQLTDGNTGWVAIDPHETLQLN